MRKSKLREYQDEMENAGWRIKTIPYDDPTKPMVVPPNWFAVIGLAILVVGLWLFFREKQKVYVALSIGGFLLIWISIIVAALTKRRNWVKIEARCIDRETAQSGRREWQFRLRCQFVLEGKTYTVTPKAFWRTFDSNEAVQSFFAKVIGQDGRCFLHVNPKNPLETELVADDIADRLLHKRP